MEELHKNEQYFFDEATLDELVEFLGGFSSVCCLCAPLLGERLEAAGASVAVLDVDDRFRHLAGFEHWDLFRPRWLGRAFDVIVCDPPFFNASLSRLFAALRTLSRNDFAQPLLVSYLKRRESAILGTFAEFGLAGTGYEPGYRTVQEREANRIEFYSNLPESVVGRLGTP